MRLFPFHPKPRVLLVEDNPADVKLTEEAFRETDGTCELEVACDGEQALRRLRECQRSPEDGPDLILLDLNLPKMNGREVLAEIKKDEHLREIPVVILTTSQADEDMRSSYDLHANCFITKPREFEEFVSMIRTIEDFWFHRAMLPTR